MPSREPRLVVSVHDVAPATADAAASWLADLDARGVPASLLVIPGEFAGGPGLADDPEFGRWLRALDAAGVHEVSLHGLTHTRQPGGAPWRQWANAVLARGAGEFSALNAVEAHTRLVAGLEIMGEAGLSVDGFTPPGWLASPGTRLALSRLGFTYWTSQTGVHDLHRGRTLRMPALSHRPGGAGERLGARVMTRAARALGGARRSFRIALHPADLERPGLRDAALHAVDVALRAGARPVTYRALVA
ncbi:polysaccharide deacetylase family protein [Actinocorallia sp. API 0066]|uniref:DUF2334 domain-containing protein n=1 Tax=Actinocorallia sp. API 0066 TaxID=2896846 RepID=UPI001E617EB6|nr:polysaccharide deacetylase family protein [Actinocorallia sp. API 0066]MCD0448590.1 polysaccharide deacetylase family protein [Actinocorallia sp. API 0066]